MPDSLKIRFFVQIDFFAAHGGQGGVNGGSEGRKDLLAWSPNNAVRFGVFTVPSFVNCMIGFSITVWIHGSMINIHDFTP